MIYYPFLQLLTFYPTSICNNFTLQRITIAERGLKLITKFVISFVVVVNFPKRTPETICCLSLSNYILETRKN